MKLSVIIVSYNVRFFLEQCLRSVFRAGEGIEMEVFVVDNNSVDGSCLMIRNQFPLVRLIANKENIGFSRANNQAMKLASGNYQLILNPDTVVEEDCFRKILVFMDSHPDAGALGVKMIDGKGNFLPESKRAFPTPWVSFYKMFGLASLFPKSKLFGQYNLSYLSKDQIHKVDVLPGAFMLLRKSALEKTGFFDESFFMYGEDIDLSYRILQAGYANYYFPETTIIHYKGESTRKGSLNYVLVFYQAMIIFAAKHFSRSNARWFSVLIRLAVYFRASISMLRRMIRRLLLPLMDGSLAFLGFVLINPVWEAYKFENGGQHPPEFLRIFVPAYILIWLFSIFFSGGYDAPVKLKRIFRGMVYGTAIILVLYSLLPEHLRFSRALIVLGFFWTLSVAVVFRLILHLVRFPGFTLDIGQKKRTVIAGNPEEAERVSRLIVDTGHPVQIAGFVAPDPGSATAANYIGSIGQISEIIRINRIDEVVFCAKDISTNEIIRYMLSLGALQTDYKIAPDSADSIIGSNSINTSGDLYVIPINSVSEPHNRRIKRLLDVLSSLILLLLSPLLIWYYWPKPMRFIWNCLRVLSGNRTWIGYAESGISPGYHLPPLRKGILNPDINPASAAYSPETWLEINLHYAKDYRLTRDLDILLKGFRRLNR